MINIFDNPQNIGLQPQVVPQQPLGFQTTPQIGVQPPLFNTNKRAFVDSILNANKNIEWVKRLRDPNAPTIQVPGEKYRSTHLMTDNGKGYVFPRVVNINGKLTYLPTDDAAEEYARKTNTGIQLPQDQGTWFSSNGYKTGTNVLNGIGGDGKPIHDPKYKIK